MRIVSRAVTFVFVLAFILCSGAAANAAVETFQLEWGSYDFYILARDRFYPRSWWSNLIASSVLYVAGGMFWNLEHREGRGVVFALANVGDGLRCELARVGVLDQVGADHVFASIRAARDAFHAAVDEEGAR